MIAGLVADGITTVSGAHHVDRGYAGFAEAMQGLGADVTREPTTRRTPGSEHGRPIVSRIVTRRSTTSPVRMGVNTGKRGQVAVDEGRGVQQMSAVATVQAPP